MANVQKTFALIVGIVLGILGIWGLFVGTNNILGFGVNYFQTILHLIAGGFGIYVGTKGEGKGFNLSIGWIGLILGILGFIPGTDSLLASWFNINSAISWLHIVVGVVALIVAYTIKD